MMADPIIFDIRRGSMDDGPGIRSTVFFKGCPLACIWCHNPESLSTRPQIFLNEHYCLGADCNACGAVCGSGDGVGGRGAIPGSPSCRACGGCAAACPGGARREAGRVYPVTELCALLARDLLYYRASHGGITLSGGEPTLHHDYIVRLLNQLKGLGIHTALQTCGVYDGERFVAEILPLLDMVFFDVKLLDSELHRRYTGSGNELILANLAELARRAPGKLIVRVPLVPGITATEENLAGIARLLGELGIGAWELLPYNPGGNLKRQRLSMAIPAGVPEHFMMPAEEMALRDRFLRTMAERTV
jgi:pyruvate formate lyase activating enzyme